MFEDYTHTKEDLEAIEEALEYLERPELDFIFKDRHLINNTLVISYDSKEIFIWMKQEHPRLRRIPCHVKGYNAYRIPHEIKINDRNQMAWRAGLRPKEISDYVSKEFHIDWGRLPKVSGGVY